NHLMIQEWVDPNHLGETIDHPWQPTRTLKGVVQFTGEKPQNTRESPAEVMLSGDLVYVRHREDVKSPLRINGFISSKQELRWEVPTPKAGEPSWKSRPYWRRVSDKSASDISNTAELAIRFARL